MLADTDTSYLEALRDRTRKTLSEVIGAETDVAIVDAPNQRNVGDTLIWAGELAYLESMGKRVAHVADLWSFDAAALRRAMPRGVVLLHGGGNLGDLWLGHQKLREHVARSLPDYRIVQLPQSIQFTDPARAASADDALGGHPDFHLLVREHLSIEKAERLLPTVTTSFCHDMALGWSPIGKRGDGDTGRSVLAIARADHEASSGLSGVDADWIPGANIDVTDWHLTGAKKAAWSAARAVAAGFRLYARGRRKVGGLPVGLPDRVSAANLRAINRLNVAAATELYARSKVVVTDRLHAHVLAALLGQPHVVLDNNYRKISSIYEEYTGGFTTAHYASDLEEARRIAAELVLD